MECIFSSRFSVPGHGVKKNSKQIRKNFKTGARFIASSSRSEFLEDWLVNKFVVERLKSRVDMPITSDIFVRILFFYPKTVYFTKDGRRSNRVGDISNLYQIVEDALQKAGVISNDSNIIGHDGSRRYPLDSKEYSLSVEIFKS
jgi:Holliday junction resolvase RusA-like endonuclease